MGLGHMAVISICKYTRNVQLPPYNEMLQGAQTFLDD